MAVGDKFLTLAWRESYPSTTAPASTYPSKNKRTFRFGRTLVMKTWVRSKMVLYYRYGITRHVCYGFSAGHQKTTWDLTNPDLAVLGLCGGQ